MRTDHVEELLDLYALGALEPDEQLVVETHLDTCLQCRSALEQSKQVIALLAWTPEQQDPPAGLYNKVAERVRRQPRREDQPGGAPRRNGRRQLFGWLSPAPRWSLGLASAAFAMALLLAVWGLGLRSDLKSMQAQLADYQQISQLLESPNVRIVVLQPQDQTVQAAQAHLLISPAMQDVYMTINNLPAPPPGMAYQLWMIADGQPVPMETFGVDEQGHVTLLLKTPDQSGTFNAAGVTVEPAAGSLQPTSAPILLTTF